MYPYFIEIVRLRAGCVEALEPESSADNDNGLFSKIWFLMEYMRVYTILYLQYIIYTIH